MHHRGSLTPSEEGSQSEPELLGPSSPPGDIPISPSLGYRKMINPAVLSLKEQHWLHWHSGWDTVNGMGMSMKGLSHPSPLLLHASHHSTSPFKVLQWLLRTENKWWGPGPGGGGWVGEILFIGMNLQMVNKLWRSNAQHSDHSQHYCITNFKVAETRSWLFSPPKEMIMWHVGSIS